MKYYVYVLYSARDGRLYIGQTKDLSNRLEVHNSGKVKSTRRRRPLRLVHYEEYTSRDKAIARERELKSISSRDFKRELRDRGSAKKFLSLTVV